MKITILHFYLYPKEYTFCGAQIEYSTTDVRLKLKNENSTVINLRWARDLSKEIPVLNHEEVCASCMLLSAGWRHQLGLELK